MTCGKLRLPSSKNLTDEQKEKVRAAKSPEELFALAKEEGMDLTDEELEAISGGSGTMWDEMLKQCPKFFI